jgi:adenosylmethionine-8-amino-7-oxononanoate aminotransferase
MSNVFHRSPRQQLPTVVEGRGIELIDSTGKRYLDASGGAAVSCLGHSHPQVVRAIQQQLDHIAYAHTSFFTNEPAEQLATTLAQAAPGDLNHVFFVSSGSEAVEASLKLARQYFVERGETGRRHFIARRQSYHGNTLGALAIGGNAGRREPFLPLLVAAHHVSPCYAYREQGAQEDDAHYAQRLADELEAKIIELGPDTVAAFVAETVVGATAGALAPVGDYLKRIRAVCDRYGVLLILDEVMSGMGRTGHLFACDEDGVVPDIIAIAKGLGAGYQPIGAMIASTRIYDTIIGGSGFFQHGHTYVAHVAACAGALAVQRVIQEEHLLNNVKKRGEQLRQLLREKFADHPHVGDVRGRGLFVGVEFVQDRLSKAPFDPHLKVYAQLKAAGMQNGLLTYPSGGTIDGVRGDHVLLAPPFICSETDIERIAEKFVSTVQNVLPG